MKSTDFEIKKIYNDSNFQLITQYGKIIFVILDDVFNVFLSNRYTKLIDKTRFKVNERKTNKFDI